MVRLIPRPSPSIACRVAWDPSGSLRGSALRRRNFLKARCMLPREARCCDTTQSHPCSFPLSFPLSIPISTALAQDDFSNLSSVDSGLLQGRVCHRVSEKQQNQIHVSRWCGSKSKIYFCVVLQMPKVAYQTRLPERAPDILYFLKVNI